MNDDDKKDPFGSAVKAANLVNEDEETKKHLHADEDNQSGDLSVMGGDAPEGVVADLDQELEDLGLDSDNNGPHPLDSQARMERNSRED